jgi:hypothetical protein
MTKWGLLLLWALISSPAEASIPVTIEQCPTHGSPTARVQVVLQRGRDGSEQLKLHQSCPPARPRRPRVVSDSRSRHEVQEVQVSVTKGRLTNLHIGKHSVIIALRPASTIRLWPDDCGIWSVEAKWLGPIGGYCEKSAAPCRAGFAEGTEPVETLCEGDSDTVEQKYCIPKGSFRLRGRAGVRFEVEPAAGGERRGVLQIPDGGVTNSFSAVYERCSRVSIVTPSGVAVLVIGPRERWTVDLGDDGTVVGGTWEIGEQQ